MKSGRSLAGGAATYLIANVLNASIPFALMPVLIRALGAEEYGRLGMFTSAMGVFSVAVGLGSIGYVRASYFKVDADQRAQILGATLVIFVATVILLGLLLAFAWLTGLQLPGLGWPEVVAGLAGGAFQFLFTLRLTLWQMAERPTRYGVTLLLATSMNACISLFLVLAIDMGWAGRAVGVMIPLCLLGVGSMAHLVWTQSIGFKYLVGRLRPILRFGLPLAPHAAMAPVLVYCERTALARGPGLEAAALLFLAAQFATPIALLANSTNLAFKPWSYKRMVAGEQAEVVRASYAAMFTIALIGCVYAALLGPLLPIIVGKHLPGAIECTSLMIGASVASAWYLIVSKGLLFVERTGTLAGISIPIHVGAAATAFVLDSPLAIAVLHLISQCLILVLVWFASHRAYPQPWLHPWTRPSSR